MKKREIANNINLYFKYINLIHLITILFIIILFHDSTILGSFAFSFLALFSYLFISKNLNFYKEKLNKEFNKNIKLWFLKKRDSIILMFSFNILNVLFFLIENVMPDYFYLLIYFVINIIFVFIYIIFLLDNKLLKNFSKVKDKKTKLCLFKETNKG